MPQEFVMLRTKANVCSAEAQINGIPICRVVPSRPLDLRPVHEYLIPGRNKFTLIAQPGPTPSRALEALPEPFVPDSKTAASLQLVSGPPGVFPDDPAVRELLLIEWTPPAGQPIAEPVPLERELEIPSVGKPWDWLSGDTFEGADSLAPVAALLAQLRESMNRRDIEPFMARAHIRFRNISAAYALNAAEEMQEFRESFLASSAEAGFRMLETDPKMMDLRICAGGKLVDCVDTFWEPVLRSAPLPNRVTRVRYPIKVARIAGKLEIVL
jgi:hypothetical protein